MTVDAERDRVRLLIRLSPTVEYPPHRQAAIKEPFVLDGELWTDDQKLHAGDYNGAAAGSVDGSVWSGTGCTGVLITSLRDAYSQT